MRKYIAELIGTFFLVFTMGMTMRGDAGAGGSIAIGAVLTVMIYAGRFISGAHYNPAITLAMLLRRSIGVKDAIAYMIVQVAGAALAAYAVEYFRPGDDYLPMWLSDKMEVVLAELVGTFALIYVALNVNTAKETAAPGYSPLAIGFTYMAMLIVFAAVHGGAFNPAVAIGIGLMNMIQWSDIWMYPAGAFGGALIAAAAFKVMSMEEK